MSEHAPSDDNPDVLAGEYVLGVLSADEMAQCAERRQLDPEFDRFVSAWERRLMPARSMTGAVALPKTLRSRIEAEMGIDRPVVPRRLIRELWIWRGLSAAGVALACGLLLTGEVRPMAGPERVTALLPPDSAGFVAWTEGRSIRVSPVSLPAIPIGRDMELWSLAAGRSTPHSLGILPASGLTLPPGALPAGRVQLLVSVEPAGGSPSGRPTGPVILAATMHVEQ